MSQEFQTYDAWLNENVNFGDCLTLYDINDEFKRLLPLTEDGEIRKFLIWDAELFQCCELLSQERDGRDFLFPSLVYANGHCIPDINNFEPERFEFYKERLIKSSDFLMRARYMNYLIEKLPQKERYQYAKCLCQESLVFLEGATVSFDFRNKFSRLVELSLSYNLNEELARTKILIETKLSDLPMNKETILESDDVSWGFLALSQCLRGFRSKLKSIILDSSNDRIIKRLEEYKNNATQISKEVFIRELIEWAQINGSNVKIVAQEYGEYYETLAIVSDSALVALAHLEKAMKIYLDYGITDKLDALKVKIKETNRILKNNGELQEHNISLKIPDELFQQQKHFIELITTGINCENMADSIHRLSSPFFVPSKEEALRYAKSSTNNSLLPMLASINCISNGRSVFIGSDIDDWEEFFLYQNYAIALNFHLQLLNSVFTKFCEQGMSAETVTGFVKERMDFIRENQIEIITRGIERFFGEDYISAIHILVPQFEGVFRCFFESYGLPTTSISSSVEQKEQTFTEFLKNDFVKALPEEYLFLVDYVMTCQLGLNLRNNVAHGLVEMQALGKGTALLVLYLFFILFGYTLTEVDDESNIK